MEENKSHKQILKSTGIVGGAQILSIVIGILRTKVVALLLGPAGIGIMGIYQSTLDLVRNATGFGINFSGVKDIAQADGSGDRERIAVTITVLRRWALATGLLGMAVTAALCVPLSRYAFDSDGYAVGLAILSITLVVTSVSAGQLALLQGLRRLSQMARATVLGAAVGTALTLPLYWLFGLRGIVPGIIVVAFVSLFFSWRFARKVKIDKPKISLAETFRRGLGMARLGFFIVVISFMSLAAMYVVRALVAREMDLAAVGFFQAAWMISNTYIGIVLNAMLADFFPRLSALGGDAAASNKLVNEQMEIALLIGGPLLIALMAFGMLVVMVLYSSSFEMAVPVLRWQLLGSLVTLVAWPMGVMFLARGKGSYVMLTDGLWCAVYVAFVFLGWDYFGFNVLGIAYLAAGAVKTLLVWLLVRRLGRFRFGRTAAGYIWVLGALGTAMAVNVLTLHGAAQYVVSGALTIVTLWFCYRKLRSTVDIAAMIRSKFPRR